MTEAVHALKQLLVREQARAYDRLRASNALSEVRALASTSRYLTSASSADEKLLVLTTALRRTTVRPVRRWLETRLRPWVTSPRADIWRRAQIGWSPYRDELADDVLPKSLLLKAPGPNGEKGVLYVSFEVNLIRLLKYHDVERLLEEYFLIGASSWSPPYYPPLLGFARLSRDPLFVQISNCADLDRLRVCEPVVRAVPIMACDWIDPSYYAPRPHSSREIDILMVAGWARFKGHWMLFRALKRMRRSLRVVLIGQDMEHRSAEDVYREAKAFGVASRIEIIRDAPVEQVTEYQCNSRTAVVLSRREGSGVATAEAFLADAPVAMLRGAHVGSASYINSSTGILTEPSRLHRDLSALVERSGSYAPRSWALAHITCHRSTARLNGILRDYAHGAGQPWTRDIATMCWRPDPIYADSAVARAMRPAYHELFERHGITIAGQQVDAPAPV